MRETIRTVCAIIAVIVQTVALYFIIHFHPR
jgi:hypothetical protein